MSLPTVYLWTEPVMASTFTVRRPSSVSLTWTTSPVSKVTDDEPVGSDSAGRAAERPCGAVDELPGAAVDDATVPHARATAAAMDVVTTRPRRTRYDMKVASPQRDNDTALPIETMTAWCDMDKNVRAAVLRHDA